MDDHSRLKTSAQSPYGRELEAGFPRLLFSDPSLEEDFRRKYVMENLRRSRIILLLGIVMVALFGLDNLRALPAAVTQPMLWVRFGLIVPALTATWIYSFWARQQTRIYPAFTLAALVLGWACVLIVYIPRQHGVEAPYEGLILVLLAITLLMGLRFRTALIVVTAVLLAYAMAAFSSPDVGSWTGELFRLSCAAVLGLIGAFILERQARQNFLSTSLLSQYALRDGLTLLGNKRKLDEHLLQIARQAERDGTRFGLIMIDVDFFKQYNDIYGHVRGDKCLRQLASVLEAAAKRPLDLAARYGGEEFVLVLYGVRERDLMQIAESLGAHLEQLAIPHSGSEVSPYVTISMGVVAQSKDQPRSPTTLLQKADAALYQAKNRGRNRIVRYQQFTDGQQNEQPARHH